MPTTSATSILSFLPLAIITLVFGITSYFLAKEKGRNILLWTVVGFIPLLNMFFIWFFIGATNLKTEQKLDEIIRSISTKI